MVAKRSMQDSNFDSRYDKSNSDDNHQIVISRKNQKDLGDGVSKRESAFTFCSEKLLFTNSREIV